MGGSNELGAVHHNGENEKKQKIAPICIIVDKKTNKNATDKGAIAKHMEETLEGKVDRITLGAESILIFPDSQAVVDEIMHPKCKFFEGCLRRNLASENTSIILTNISFNEITLNSNIKQALENLGLSGFAKLSINHDQSRNVVKAYCNTPEIRKTALEFEIEIVIGNSVKKIFTEPSIRPIRQCQKCKLFGHKVAECQNAAVCAKCNKTDHDEKSCSNQRLSCANCFGTNHGSYSRQCGEYRKLKEAEVDQELVKIGITSKRGRVLNSNKYTAEMRKENFSKICGFSKELEVMNKKITNLAHSNQPTVEQSQKILEEIKKENSENIKLLTNSIQSIISQVSSLVKEECTNLYFTVTKETDVKINQLATASNSQFESLKQEIMDIKSSIRANYGQVPPQARGNNGQTIQSLTDHPYAKYSGTQLPWNALQQSAQVVKILSPHDAQ